MGVSFSSTSSEGAKEEVDSAHHKGSSLTRHKPYVPSHLPLCQIHLALATHPTPQLVLSGSLVLGDILSIVVALLPLLLILLLQVLNGHAPLPARRSSPSAQNASSLSLSVFLSFFVSFILLALSLSLTGTWERELLSKTKKSRGGSQQHRRGSSKFVLTPGRLPSCTPQRHEMRSQTS